MLNKYSEEKNRKTIIIEKNEEEKKNIVKNIMKIYGYTRYVNTSLQFCTIHKNDTAEFSSWLLKFIIFNNNEIIKS